MDAVTLLAIGFLLAQALTAWKCLYHFNYSNGLMGYLYKAVVANRAPSGRPLKILSTQGYSKWIDVRLPGSAVFQLLLFEDWSHPDTACAGAYFTSSFCAAWALIILESLRAYNMNNFAIGTWTTLAGVFMFNYTPALGMPLYLAARFAFLTPPNLTAEDVLIDRVQLDVLPWAFLLGYIVPFVLMLLPDLELRGFSSKHTLAAWWQQWPAYVALFHAVFLLFPRSQDQVRAGPPEILYQLEHIYIFILVIAAASHWGPIVAGFVKGVTMMELFMPSASNNMNEYAASKWTVQWDSIMDHLAMMIWASVLFWQTRGFPTPPVLLSALWYGFLGGPLGSIIALLWERDRSILGN